MDAICQYKRGPYLRNRLSVDGCQLPVQKGPVFKKQVLTKETVRFKVATKGRLKINDFMNHEWVGDRMRAIELCGDGDKGHFKICS
jgi:hypothetical protein